MAAAKTVKYIEGIGRRKEAVARVRITPTSRSTFVVNDKKVDEYFTLPRLQESASQALEKSGGQKFSVSVYVKGGGQTAQAEAIRLGIARALVKGDENLRGELKEAGWLKRDARVVERKKFGLRKARRAPQWSKR